MTALTIFASFGVSYLLTMAARRYAFASQLLDVPNSRSSHSVPTPSGGGVAIVASWGIVMMALFFSGHSDFSFQLAVVVPAFIVAGIGYLDDKRDISRVLRFSVQVAAVIWFFYVMENPLSVGISWLDDVPILGYMLSGFALVWLTNLFNFMDGIDGIAASQAIFVALGMVVISSLTVLNGSLVLVNIALAGACLGFLIWNWPPAKIFMGDAGSSFLGFVLGAIALIISTEYAISVWPWVILFGIFLIDSTVTLVRRASSGQRWYEAHRSHAYQRRARHWGSHRKVTLSVIGINVCWLLPMAFWAAVMPDYAAAIAGLALLPLTALALWIGAGKPDSE